MSKLALGIIETVGLAAAIDAADVAAKSANIQVIGYELTKGNGMAVVKIEGTVGAVKAAIDAAAASAAKINRVWSKSVIPRPNDSLEIFTYSKETVGLESDGSEEEENTSDLQEELEDDVISIIEDENLGEDKNLDEYEDMNNVEEHTEPVQDDSDKQEITDKEEYEEESVTCNLCKDPECSRRKGDLRVMCIHYEELKKEGRI